MACFIVSYATLHDLGASGCGACDNNQCGWHANSQLAAHGGIQHSGSMLCPGMLAQSVGAGNRGLPAGGAQDGLPVARAARRLPLHNLRGTSTGAAWSATGNAAAPLTPALLCACGLSRHPPSYSRCLRASGTAGQGIGDHTCIVSGGKGCCAKAHCHPG